MKNNHYLIHHFTKRTSALRWKFVILSSAFVFLQTSISFSKNYYFSATDGNDDYTEIQAQNPVTPWKSIDKLNKSMNLFNGGDIIYFKRGDIFRGQIQMTRSGTLTSRIIFDAYGTGNDPVISGNLEINTWIRYKGNIWVADCPQLGSTVNNFFINGKSQQIGRYPNLNSPNKGYLTITTHSGNTQITSASLTSSPDWNGGEAVVRTERWILDRVTILSQQNQTLVFSGPTNYSIKDNYGFFIQKHINTLDQQGEWYFDTGSRKMYLFSSVDPNSFRTEADFLNSTFIASYQYFFTVRNIEFMGSLNTNMKLYRANNVEITDCIFSESGTDAVYFAECYKIRFNRNEIRNTNNNALLLISSSNIEVTNNKIHNTGTRAGMGILYGGVDMDNSIENLLFENNVMDSLGYSGISFEGNSITIRNNVISHFCTILDDGSAVYEPGYNGKNRLVENNILLNGIGAGEGTASPAYSAAEGIYIDDRASNVTLINNTVANCSRGIFIHNASNISIIGNTLFNNKTQLLFVHDDIAPDFPVTNCTVKNNILFSKSNLQRVAEFKTIDNGIPNFGTFDNNYYCLPFRDELLFNTQFLGTSGLVSEFITFETWQNKYKYDLNSYRCPVIISAYNIMDFAGANKIINGTFDANISGWSCWSAYPNFNASWDQNGKLDLGSLKVGFTAPSGNSNADVNFYRSFGNAVGNKNYILRFAAVGTFPQKLLEIFIINNVSPWNSLTPTQRISLNPNRKEYELMFTPMSTNSNTCIGFTFHEDAGPIWIDNVELYEANIVPANIDDSIKFIYNASDKALTYTLNQSYIDVRGAKYSGTKTLLPFTSAILMLDPNPSALLPDPLYLSSVIENKNPDQIEMVYSLSLTDVLPDNSAFTVMVNSEARAVKTVSVSGQKVLLTLASPVVNGDIVTVAYTKPYSNPLQTQAGAQAATMSEQSVTNNCFYQSSNPANISVYPNPANEFINFSQPEASSEPKTVRIFDFSGKLCSETQVNPYITLLQIPLYLKSGLYILQALMGSVIMFNQKLIISN